MMQRELNITGLSLCGKRHSRNAAEPFRIKKSLGKDKGAAPQQTAGNETCRQRADKFSRFIQQNVYSARNHHRILNEKVQNRKKYLHPYRNKEVITMKAARRIALIILVLAALVTGASSLVITQENEYSLIRQFGKIDHVVADAGISFKIPFIQSVDKLPKQVLLYDLPASDVITSDKKTMICDSYILWQITDPQKFAQTLNSSITNAEGRLDAIVYNSTKNVISSTSQDDVISGRDGQLSSAIIANIGTSLNQYGIKLLSFETKKLDLPGDNKAAVYERMISERDNIAATYTAEGSSEAQIIRNTTDKEVTVLLSEADKEAAILIAEGEAEYMRILSNAYNDPSKQEFYSFVRSLDALKASMKGNRKTVILSPDSPIAQIFYGGQ